MSRTKEQLLAASNQVKNETQQGANTADRIGGILYDISEHIGEGGGGGGDDVYVISTINDNAVIDDQTTTPEALREATLNPITVYKGTQNVTSQCQFTPTASLPSTLVVSTTTDSRYPDAKVYVIQPTQTVSSITPGNYYYDIQIIHSGAVIGSKRFKLYVDADISADGSFYKLSIENDTISYSGSGTRLTTVNPIIKAYKINLDGSSEQINVTPVERISSITPVANTAYAELGSLYGAVSATGSQRAIELTGTIAYNYNGYDVTLYNGSHFSDGPEHIDCIKDGKDGGAPKDVLNTKYYFQATNSDQLPTEGADAAPNNWHEGKDDAWSAAKPYLYCQELTIYTDDTPSNPSRSWGGIYFKALWVEAEAAYVITTVNDNAVIDDQTTGSQALRIATLNPIKVYKGNDNVTSSCTYTIANETLPQGLAVRTTTDSEFSDYKCYEIYPTASIGVTLTPGNYYYDVVITHGADSVGTKRFKLYIDANISTDGSFYKLSIENDVISYDFDGNKTSTVNPVARAYKISNTGVSQSVDINVVTSIPASASDTMYIVVGSVLFNAKSASSGNSITFDASSIPYSADGYSVTLYKGNSYADGPEQIDCTKAGGDGYSLVVNPSYGIFDEFLDGGHTDEQTGVTVFWAAPFTQEALGEWYAIVQVLKGKTPQVVGYNSLTYTTCTAVVTDENGNTPGSSTTSLKVSVTHIPQKLWPNTIETGWNKTEGKIAFVVTVNGTNFHRVEIPIYINRLGSRFQTIAGDVETTIMTKCTYKDENGNVVRGDTMGNYVRSSELNRQALTEKVNDIEINNSEIKQTSDEISMSVNNGWYNYITNPLGVEGTKGVIDTDSAHTINDSVLGDILQLSRTVPEGQTPGDWQLTFLLNNTKYTNLTGQTVSWFCVVKNLNTSDGGTVNFGSGYEQENSGNQHAALQITSNRGNISINMGLLNPTGYTYYDLSTEKCGAIELQDKWYLCWGSVKLSSGRTIIAGQNYPGLVGFNSMSGTWQIYYAGIVMGCGYPSLDMIMTGAGLKKAGIDIRDGVVDLKANRTNFSYYDKQAEKWKSDKIWIDNTTGTLNAVNAMLSGFVRKSKVIITSSNYSQYTRIKTTSSTTTYLDIRKCGSFIEIQSLPSGADSISMPILSGQIISYFTDEEKDEVKSYIGSKVIIYNKSGVAINMTIKVSNTPTVVVIASGKFAELDCKLDVDAISNEIIYWSQGATGNYLG